MKGGCRVRILIVEDERRLASIIQRGLCEENYSVDNAYDGEEAQYMINNTHYDLVILDIMLPVKDGIAICRETRIRKNNVPILMLTAKDSVEDKVKGLDCGSDDYLVKPFAFSELLARVRALLRRNVSTRSVKLQVNNLVMDTLSHEVWRGSRKIDLAGKEYSILEYFMRHPNLVLSRTMLEENAWNYDYDSSSNVIDVYIRHIRSKIDEPGDASLIQTIRGAGYKLRL
jgi:DNA-binding response OmpR family regulator